MNIYNYFCSPIACRSLMIGRSNVLTIAELHNRWFFRYGCRVDLLLQQKEPSQRGDSRTRSCAKHVECLQFESPWLWYFLLLCTIEAEGTRFLGLSGGEEGSCRIREGCCLGTCDWRVSGACCSFYSSWGACFGSSRLEFPQIRNSRRRICRRSVNDQFGRFGIRPEKYIYSHREWDHIEESRTVD